MKMNRIAALCAVFALEICAWGAIQGQSTDEARRVEPQSGIDQIPEPASQVVERVDLNRLVRLAGNVHPLAQPQFDRGLVDPQMQLDRMMLVLKRSPAKEAALEAFMARQQDEKSPDYHHWLTADEFGRLYGPTDSDIAAVKSWLENEGFRVDDVTRGRIFLHFSGTAGQVAKTFHTEIHHYNVYGEEHISNDRDISIPQALEPAVVGVFSLNNFFSKPQHVSLGSFRRDPKTGKWIPVDPDQISRPMFGVPQSSGDPFELISPFDFATIYNVLPLWNGATKIDGTGQTIAIAGRSTISASDVNTFRSTFGLPAKPFVLVNNGPAPKPTDPGDTGSDIVENTLDVEWSGAVAKNATIKFVTTASTSTTDGAAESADYIIEGQSTPIAPIMSFSYGNCELAYGTQGNSAFSQLWQLGAGEGISIFVASGDQGSAACDGGQQAPYGAKFGLAVSGPSSTQYNVAVGGTDFPWMDIGGVDKLSTYWASSNNSTNLSSAKSYIPEIPWNGTCTNDTVLDLINTANGLTFDEETLCNQSVIQGVDEFLVNVVGGTGGKSACTTPTSNTVASCKGGWPKPTWQTGSNVPADGKRDVPDVSLFAASGLLNTAYVICDSQIGPCDFKTNGNDAVAQGVGGTSVASPAMAGIMALIEQSSGGKPLGLPNAKFYQIASKQNWAACNSNTVAGGNACSFYDVTSGNNKVPCASGSPNCTVSHSGDTYGVISGYKTGTGFDLATGLGSVNATNLVHAWGGSTTTGSVTLTPSPVAFPVTVKGQTSAAQAVTVKNTGTSSVTLSSISITGTNPTSFLQVNTCGTSLGAGASCTAYVAFKPTATGALKATLSVADTASGSPQTAALTGTGAGADSVTLSATTMAFGSVTHGTTSAAKSVTVTNHGTTILDITGITVTGTGAADFVVLTTCGATLAPATTCTIDVAFKPAAVASYSATVNITDNGATTSQHIALTGTGK